MAATTTTITIPDEVRDALEAYGRTHGLPDDLTAIVEAYLDQRLGQAVAASPRPKGPLRITPSDRGSGRSDVSVHHDHYVAEAIAERKVDGPR